METDRISGKWHCCGVIEPSIQENGTCPVTRADSDGRCNTIWYKAVFKGGVYETRETIWAFGGAEIRRVASLESRADFA
jgi:hypothetical protein